MAYLLWITFVVGGAYMGGGALWAQVQTGFDPLLALNTALYLGCALYGLPKLVALLRGGGKG